MPIIDSRSPSSSRRRTARVSDRLRPGWHSHHRGRLRRRGNTMADGTTRRPVRRSPREIRSERRVELLESTHLPSEATSSPPPSLVVAIVVVVERRRHRCARWLVVVSPRTGIAPNAHAQSLPPVRYDRSSSSWNDDVIIAPHGWLSCRLAQALRRTPAPTTHQRLRLLPRGHS